ncbi:hypothetical protein C7H84_24490 [Burkholderia sp. Nafp2/4-1b]|nr:hypothetical protein C7H84_24490 [Burkholderia sp. Nafp2/4-1b]
MNLFRDNESGGERKGGAVAGRGCAANRTKHGRRDDARALYRAVVPARLDAGSTAPRRLRHRGPSRKHGRIPHCVPGSRTASAILALRKF